MSSHSTSTALFLSVVISTLIFSLFQAGVAAAQTNTSLGAGALQSNTTGSNNTAIGFVALGSNTAGINNLLPESIRSLAIAQAAPTPLTGSMPSRATPRAPSTLLPGCRH